MRSISVLLVLALTPLCFAAVAVPLRTGTLIDYTERRIARDDSINWNLANGIASAIMRTRSGPYQQHITLCNVWIYAIRSEGFVYVGAAEGCSSFSRRPVEPVVNQSIQFQTAMRFNEGALGLLNRNGKISWLRLIKTVDESMGTMPPLNSIDPEGASAPRVVIEDMHPIPIHSGPPLRPAPPEQFAISVSSIPSGATIYADGRQLGITPATIQLDSGQHMIGVQKQGFKTWGKSMELSAPMDVSAQLEAEPQESPSVIKIGKGHSEGTR